MVAKDPETVEVIWITEVWESKEVHAASLGLPSVRDAIAQGRRRSPEGNVWMGSVVEGAGHRP